MNKFPQALYLAGGVEKLESGLFTTKLVNDENELEVSLADGWHTCQEDANAAKEAAEAEALAARLEAEEKARAPEPAPAPTPTYTAVPETPPAPAPAPAPATGEAADKADQATTRAELEAKATELGIVWNYRWGDKKLADVIAATQEA